MLPICSVEIKSTFVGSNGGWKRRGSGLPWLLVSCAVGIVGKQIYTFSTQFLNGELFHGPDG